MNSEERYSRQADLVPMDKLDSCNISIIGVGAIGRQVSLQLAAMGAKTLHLIDHDKVEISNIASQGYFENDLGINKVVATSIACENINSEIDINIANSKFRRSDPIGNIVFCCVDKIETRAHIWDSIKDNVDFFVDGRMSAEVLRIISASDSESKEYYPSTLFAAAEAHTGSCTAKTTIYCANLAAAYMISRFTKWLRGIPSEKDIMLNLLSEELMVA